MKTKQQFLSLVLLTIVSASIFPVESFHSHEIPHIICKEATKHIEEKKFECDLCEFVLPIFELSKATPYCFFAVASTEEITHFQLPVSRELFDIPQYRGPPFA